MNFVDEVTGKNVLIFGLGLQGGGLGDAEWLVEHGARVRATDQKTSKQLESSLRKLPTTVSLSLGGHKMSDIDWADIIIKNPGVPDNSEFIKYAKSSGKPVYTSIALVVKAAPSKVIGITGTRGKSTTTELIYALLSRSHPGKVKKGGNVPGTSGLRLLDELENLDYLVLELSSFQLHSFHDLEISPHIAVVTNLYPDHLNRYDSMEEYFFDKSALTRYQTPGDLCIAFSGNAGSQSLSSLSPGKVIEYAPSDVPSTWTTPLRGAHNQENIAATLAIARELRLDEGMVKDVVEGFATLSFRLETVGQVTGIEYVNDTTSTTPVATIKAVESLANPTTLILGGDTKNLPTDELVSSLANSRFVEKIVLLGCKNIPKFVSELRSACQAKIVGQVDSMDQAVALATAVSKPGWTVLLSPGFASFDLFANEFDRGRQFNECIHKLSE